MTPIREKLIELRACLDKIQEALLASTASVKAEVIQSLILDEEGAKALAALSRDIEGNVFLINSAMVNMQVVQNSEAASRKLTDIELCYMENGTTLDLALDDLITKGWKMREIEKMVRDKCFKIAEGLEKTKSETARRLGIRRTTYIEQKKKLGDTKN